MSRLQDWLARVDRAIEHWLHELAHPDPEAREHRRWQ